MKKPKKLSKLKKDAWDALSLYMRMKFADGDGYKICPNCKTNTHYKQLHAHHIIPKSKGLSVYFLEDNILILCRDCHFLWHRQMSPQEEMSLINHVMPEEYKRAEKVKNQTIKLSEREKREWYTELTETYKKKASEQWAREEMR